MVMTKQEGGVKRHRRKAETDDSGKLVTTEYNITAEPPLVPEKVDLGWTERISKGSVSTWKAHPVTGKAVEHANHTLAVHELIEAFRTAGGGIAAVEPPAQKPAKPAKETKGPRATGRGGARVSKQSKEQAAKPAPEPSQAPAVLDAGQAEKAARSTTTSRGRRKPSARAAAAAAAPDPTPGGPTEVMASGGVVLSAATADEPPALPETELAHVGPEHAAALEDEADRAAVAASRAEDGPGVPHEQVMAESAALEDAVLTDPEAAAAVGAPEGWGEGYPEPGGKHRAPAPAANPFEPDPDSPFSGTGFVR
jgi:hypothetical protein